MPKLTKHELEVKYLNDEINDLKMEINNLKKGNASQATNKKLKKDIKLLTIIAGEAEDTIKILREKNKSIKENHVLACYCNDKIIKRIKVFLDTIILNSNSVSGISCGNSTLHGLVRINAIHTKRVLDELDNFDTKEDLEEEYLPF